MQAARTVTAHPSATLLARFAAVALLLATAVACTTVMQSAEVVAPGQVAVGLGGAVGLPNGVGFGGGAAYVRVGVADRLDMGFKAEGPVPLIFTLDAKYQVVRADRFLVAADLGIAYFIPASDLGVVAMALAGTDRWYGGVRVTAGAPSAGSEFNILPEVVAGVSFGDRLRVLGEAQFVAPSLSLPTDGGAATWQVDQLAVKLGVALQLMIGEPKT